MAWPRRALVALLTVCGIAAEVAAVPPRRFDLLEDAPGVGGLAAPANGQTLYVLDETDGSVLAVDPFEPVKRRSVLAPGKNGTARRPVAIGCIDTTMVVLLCRGPDGWALETHRLQPDAAADPATPAQTVPVGSTRGEVVAAASATAAAGRPALVVSPSRDWLAVCGLPAPLPPVLRAPIAGARIGTISAKGCPVLPGAVRPVAAAVSAADEFVLFVPEPGSAGIWASYSLPTVPRRLLHVDTGLSRVRDASFCRAAGTLWVVGGGAAGSSAGTAQEGSSAGLWRIDAVLRDGRQAAEAVSVVRLEDPRAVVCLSERAIVVAHGRVVSRFEFERPEEAP